MKYIRIHNEIDAIQYNGNNKNEIEELFGIKVNEYCDFGSIEYYTNNPPKNSFYLSILTSYGEFRVNSGDYIIKDSEGIRPYKSDIFNTIYKLIQ